MHNSETKIMKIQKMVMEEFGIPAAIAVHGALTQTSPSEIEDSHGLFGGNALHELQTEYRESLNSEQ